MSFKPPPLSSLPFGCEAAASLQRFRVRTSSVTAATASCQTCRQQQPTVLRTRLDYLFSNAARWTTTDSTELFAPGALLSANGPCVMAATTKLMLQAWFFASVLPETRATVFMTQAGALHSRVSFCDFRLNLSHFSCFAVVLQSTHAFIVSYTKYCSFFECAVSVAKGEIIRNRFLSARYCINLQSSHQCATSHESMRHVAWIDVPRHTNERFLHAFDLFFPTPKIFFVNHPALDQHAPERLLVPCHNRAHVCPSSSHCSLMIVARSARHWCKKQAQTFCVFSISSLLVCFPSFFFTSKRFPLLSWSSSFFVYEIQSSNSAKFDLSASERHLGATGRPRHVGYWCVCLDARLWKKFWKLFRPLLMARTDLNFALVGNKANVLHRL